jgi:hypothetical protein
MKELFLTGIAALFLATGTAHAYPPVIMTAARLLLKFKPLKGALLVVEGSFQRHGLFKKIGKGRIGQTCVLSLH